MRHPCNGCLILVVVVVGIVFFQPACNVNNPNALVGIGFMLGSSDDRFLDRRPWSRNRKAFENSVTVSHVLQTYMMRNLGSFIIFLLGSVFIMYLLAVEYMLKTCMKYKFLT